MLCARIRHVGIRACRTRVSAGAGRDAVGTGGHHAGSKTYSEVSSSHAVHLLGKGLPSFALALLILLLPGIAYGAPSLEVDGNFAGYEDGEEYKGYVVVDSPDNYQSTLCLIGEWSKLPQITTEQYETLSNPSTGGAFYELSQLWKKLGRNASGTDEYYPQWLALSEDFADGLVTVYGYGKVWAAVCTDDLKQQAKEDFNTILGGGDVGGGSGSGSSSEINGSTVTFILDPVYARYDNCHPPTSYDYYKIDGAGYRTIVDNGSGFAPTIEFDITFNREIPYQNAKVYATLTPTYNGKSDLVLYIGNDLVINEYTTEYIQNAIDPDLPATCSTLTRKITRSGDYIIFVERFSSLQSKNVLTNQSFSNITNGSPVTVPVGDNKPSFGYYFTDYATSDDPEPSPDPWEPPTTPETPTNPTTPTPKDPITPDPPSLPGAPSDPVQPAPPQSPTVGDGGTFTVDLQGILDALDEHCIHIQTCLNSNFSGQNSYLGELFSTYTAAIVDQIYNGDVSKIGAIGDVNNTIAQGFSDIFEYWDDYTEWLDKKLDFKIPESDPYDDKDLLNWIRKIWARQGTGDVNTRPVDPATNYGGMTKWLGVLYGKITGDVSDTSITALSTSLNALQHTFPFSLPWDIQQILQALDATPATPAASITVPALAGAWDAYNYDIDLHWLDSAMVAVRGFELLAFVLYCLVHTKEVFGYVVGD